MRILQVSPNDGHGGAERIALDLHRAYRAAGHDARLVVGKKHGDDPTVVPLDPAGRPAPHQGWVSRLLGHDAPGHPATASLLDRLPPDVTPPPDEPPDAPPDIPPDVLHLNNLHGHGYFDLRALPALSRRQPTVLTPHDAWLFTGGPTYALRPPTWREHRRLARRAALFAESELHLVASSRWIVEQALASPLGEHFRSTRVIPVGIDTQVFHPGTDDDRAAVRAALGIESQRPVALFVAHDAHRHPFKDFATIRAAVGMTRHDMILLVAGTAGPAETLGPCTVRYLGLLGDDTALVSAYHAADVLVHIAHADNFPNVILEAMGCGLPVIANGVGGIPEQVTDEVTGRLLLLSDPPVVAHALDLIFDDRDRAAQLGVNGRKHVETHHDLTRQAAVNLEHYQALPA